MELIVERLGYKGIGNKQCRNRGNNFKKIKKRPDDCTGTLLKYLLKSGCFQGSFLFLDPGAFTAALTLVVKLGAAYAT
jgi:hypothetical protein